MLDFGPVRRNQTTLQEMAGGLTAGDLAALTDEMCDLQLRLMAGLEDQDAVFVPDDPEADDTFAATPEEGHLPWTLGHVITHTTASSEEQAALALTLARGLEPAGRSRFEVPWREARSAAFLRERVEESRRMRRAMLEAWPRVPHLEVFHSTRPGGQLVNAAGRFLSGLAHDDSHLAQIEKVVAQARRARLGCGGSA